MILMDDGKKQNSWICWKAQIPPHTSSIVDLIRVHGPCNMRWKLKGLDWQPFLTACMNLGVLAQARCRWLV